MYCSDGDMRQGLNNLQATSAGFGVVNSENVYKVCDQPHPMLIAGMINKCVDGRLEDAYAPLMKLHNAGYAAADIITSIFRVCKTMDLPEYYKLEVRALPGGSYEPAAHDFELGGGDSVQVLGEKN